MITPLVLKLEHGAPLTQADKREMQKAVARQRRVGAHQDLIREGDAPEDVQLVLEGFACRHKVMPNGERSIMALLVPGDFCDLHVAILGEMDHNISTLCPCTVAVIPRAVIEDLTLHHPRIARALWWASLADEGVLREWIVSLGRRGANERTAHLFCELLARLEVVGLAEGNSYDLPLSQTELADVIGVSAVHMNRTLQSLRDLEMISWEHKRLTVHNPVLLKAYAGFRPNYLHLRDRLPSC